MAKTSGTTSVPSRRCWAWSLKRTAWTRSWTVIQNLLAYGRFFNMPRETVRQRSWEALDLFQLREKARQKPDELSGGMRRWLLIARALLHEPSILVLDEPTTGLDPHTRLAVWEKLIFLKSQGITMLMTTHYMEEASYLCDRLVVMDEGRILVEGSPAELVRKHAGEEVVEIRAREADKAELIDSLRGQGLDFQSWGDSVLVYGENGALSGELPDFDGYHVVRRPGNLEDVFLRLTRRRLREE